MSIYRQPAASEPKRPWWRDILWHRALLLIVLSPVLATLFAVYQLGKGAEWVLEEFIRRAESVLRRFD